MIKVMLSAELGLVGRSSRTYERSTVSGGPTVTNKDGRSTCL